MYPRLKREIKRCLIVNITLRGHVRVHEKEVEKIEKYQELKREIKRLWKLRTVQIVPVVVGALGSVTKRLRDFIKKLDITIQTRFLQKTALLGTARILRKVLDI